MPAAPCHRAGLVGARRCGKRPLAPTPALPGVEAGGFLPVAADQEVEVSALVSLQHVVDVQAVVAARMAIRGGRAPRGAAAGQLLVRDIQVEASVRYVQLDPDALPHPAQRPADRSLAG